MLFGRGVVGYIFFKPTKNTKRQIPTLFDSQTYVLHFRSISLYEQH